MTEPSTQPPTATTAAVPEGISASLSLALADNSVGDGAQRASRGTKHRADSDGDDSGAAPSTKRQKVSRRFLLPEICTIIATYFGFNEYTESDRTALVTSYLPGASLAVWEREARARAVAEDNGTMLMHSRKSITVAGRVENVFHCEIGPALVVRPPPDTPAEQASRWMRTEYFLLGRYHRVDGPAYTAWNCQIWYRYGLPHREDGPAIVYSEKHLSDREPKWALRGVYYHTEEEFLRALTSPEYRDSSFPW